MKNFDNIQTWQQDSYLISTDKNKLDIPLIYEFLSNSYWAKNRSHEQIQTSIQHSLCFGLYHQDQQIGFARILSDFATFSYLADVFVLPKYQNQGLGKWLLTTILNTQEIIDSSRCFLLTLDAQKLYESMGFKNFPYPERMMFIET